MYLNKINGLLDRIEIPFLLFWEFMLIVRMVSVYSLLPSSFDSGIFSLIAIIGIALLLRTGILWLLKRKKLEFLLILFTIAIFVSSVVAFDGLLSNLKIIFWQMLYFFVVYEIGNRNEKKSFDYVEKLLVFTWFILVSIALGMFLMRYSRAIPLDKLYHGIRLGFFQNRLFGIFSDPNFAATISVITILFSAHLFVKSVKIMKIFLLVNTLFQFIYIVLSGSRTAQLELFVVTISLAFFITYRLNLKGSFFKKYLLPVGISILTVAVVYIGYGGTQKISVAVINEINQMNEKEDIANNFVSDDSISDVPTTLNRDDVTSNADASNGRFELWRSAYDIFRTRKLLGTSPRNYLQYAKTELPNTWIAVKEMTPHNFFFYLLATTGLLGTIPFILFLVIKIVNSLRQLIKANLKNYYEYLYYISVVLVVLVSACLLTDIVLVNKLGAFLFYLYMGKVNFMNNHIVNFKE